LDRFLGLFAGKKRLTVSLYGPPNGGKTTLANRICADWVGEEMGSTSPIAHETRELQHKYGIKVLHEDGRSVTFTLVDTPGISSRIDYKDFVKEGLSEAAAKERAREAATGVVASVDALVDVDFVLLVLDATKEPGNQVNTTLVTHLEEREIPFLIIANKLDLKKASLEKIREVYPDSTVVGISAKFGDHMDVFYEKLFEVAS